tara:strand:- start:5 stop:109 length:105 start_codon:yes stop_codon:yes gene_type:complete
VKTEKDYKKGFWDNFNVALYALVKQVKKSKTKKC